MYTYIFLVIQIISLLQQKQNYHQLKKVEENTH
jgi:hypothetical protein